MIQVPRDRHLLTPRLVLRPSTPEDAARAVAIQSDWRVARMLRMAAFPPDLEAMGRWFEDHAREWRAGTAFRFAVEREERTIGLADIDGVDGVSAELGYWLEAAAWRQGYATEAARAVVGFAFETLGLTFLKSGYAADNPASGRVLGKLGFREVERRVQWSRSRNAEIEHVRLTLESVAAN